MKNKVNELIETKDKVLHLINQSALWRLKKQKQYPGDARNGECAQALYKLYKVVEGMSNEHPFFIKYAGLDTDGLEDFNRLIGRYGFISEREEVYPDKFINEMIMNK